jgi:excisionase family DNA binding protein
MDPVASLVTRWRNDATTLRRHGALHQAAVLEGCADELEQKLQGVRDELLTVEEAAVESGYNAESLRRMVRSGKLPSERNIGQRTHIRIRRRDLPRKPRNPRNHTADSRRPGKEYNPEEDARDIAKRLGGLNG